MMESGLSPLEREALEVEIKYAGFVKRQQAELAQMEGQHRRRIPADIDYHLIATLSMEAREKLAKVHHPSPYIWLITRISLVCCMAGQAVIEQLT